MSKKKSFLDEDNTFTRGVIRGNNSAMRVKAFFSEDRAKFYLRLVLALLVIFFLVRLFF